MGCRFLKYKMDEYKGATSARIKQRWGRTGDANKCTRRHITESLDYRSGVMKLGVQGDGAQRTAGAVHRYTDIQGVASACGGKQRVRTALTTHYSRRQGTELEG